MNQWCVLSPETIIPRGQFTEAQLQPLSGMPLHKETTFLNEWARLLMDRYESEQPTTTFLVVENVILETPERNKHFYRRLFTNTGDPTQDFITWSSETLAWWMETTFGNVLFVEGNPPHTNDPVYDVLSLVLNTQNAPTLRLVQVKATPKALHHNCSLALGKFQLQETGWFDTELKAKLQLFQRCGLLAPDIQIRDLLYDPEKRYRLTIVHGEDRNKVQILTTFNSKVKGGVDRRSAYLVEVSNWKLFWQALAKVVYAQLS